jgi:hypothetical protein
LFFSTLAARYGVAHKDPESRDFDWIGQKMLLHTFHCTGKYKDGSKACAIRARNEVLSYATGQGFLHVCIGHSAFSLRERSAGREISVTVSNLLPLHHVILFFPASAQRFNNSLRNSTSFSKDID